MCAALIGDLEWLRHTCSTVAGFGAWRLACLSGEEKCLDEIVNRSDAVVLVTDQVSHRTRRSVMAAALKMNIPVFMRHSSGAQLFRACLNELETVGANNV